MNTLDELKKQTLLGQELLDRTKQRLSELQQQLNCERQQRLADEAVAAAAKARGKILQEIGRTCIPGSENHLLTLLDAQSLLGIDDGRIFIKSTDQYGQPASIPLETGLFKLIQEQFPHFLASEEEESIASPTQPSKSNREKLESMSDRELLSLVADPEKMTKLVNSL